MSAREKELVLWFDNLRNTDVSIVGGKNASLGEMIHAALPVPFGFAVTAFSYERYIQEKKIAEQFIHHMNFCFSKFLLEMKAKPVGISPALFHKKV